MVKGSELRRGLEETLAESLRASWQWQLRPLRGINEPDAELILTDPTGKSIRVLVEFKARLAPSELAKQLEWYSRRSRPTLVVAPAIGPRARELMDRAGISWLEVRGDYRIAADGLLAQRLGADRRRRGTTVETSTRFVADLFSGLAMRVVRWLLIEPERVWTVTEMARRARASLGFVSRTFATLAREAYVVRERSGTRLVERDDLLNAWAKAKPPEEERVEGVYLPGPGALLSAISARPRTPIYAVTAEAAAEQVAPFARFRRVELYVQEPADWMRRMELTPVPTGGNAVLIRSKDESVYDGSFEVKGLRLVSLPQLYVDLARRAGPGSQVAEFLRQRMDAIRRRTELSRPMKA